MVGDFGQKKLEVFNKIKVHKSYKLGLGREKLFKRIILALPKILKTFRVLKKINTDICIQRAFGIETFIIALFCKIFRKKFIYMVAHEVDVSGEYEKRHGLKGKLCTVGMKLADLVIAQHQTQKELLKKEINKESIIIKSVYTINQVDKKKSDYILWIARSDEWKKPELFLALAQRFGKERFVMICPRAAASPDLFNKIKRESKKIANLKFIDYIPFKKNDLYFQKAKILINTSEHEGFPNTFIQAAKNRTPILSLRVNPDGMLEKYKIGMCANGNFEKMIEQLKILLENKKLWQEMLENGYKYAKENHDIKKIIKEYKKILYSLIGKNK